MKEAIELLAEFLVREFQKELEEQGHVATGNLKDNIEYEINEKSGGFEITFSSEEYGKYLDTGTKSGRWVPIDRLIEWIEVKGIASGEKDIKNAAYAIQRKIYQEGTPTQGSYKYSNNGRRTDWIQFVAETNKVKINKRLVAFIGEEINTELFNIAKQITV